MRHRNFLPIFLLSLTLAAPAALAEPIAGATAFTEQDPKEKDREKKRDRARDRDRDRDRDDDRRRGPRDVPPGHLPPPGECRVWYYGVPPGHQPPPTDCATARREAARRGGRVIYGDDRRDDRWEDDRRRDDDRWDDDRRRDDDRWDDRRWLRDFETLDRDGDGYLSRREWTADDRTFELLDLDRDGRLSRREIRDAGQRHRRDLLKHWFEVRDDDRDGRLTPREWRGDEEGFERLDLDRDGYLSWDEVLESLRRRR